jgi:hypothetical protein
VQASVPWRRVDSEKTPDRLLRVVDRVPGPLRAAAPLPGGATDCGGSHTLFVDAEERLLARGVGDAVDHNGKLGCIG